MCLSFSLLEYGYNVCIFSVYFHLECLICMNSVFPSTNLENTDVFSNDFGTASNVYNTLTEQVFVLTFRNSWCHVINQVLVIFYSYVYFGK